MGIFTQTKKLAISFLLLFGLLSPLAVSSTASASLFEGAKEEACAGAQLSKPPQACDESAQTGLSTTINRIIDLLSIIVGIISVIMVIISGFRLVTSNGDSNKITSARNTFIYALVGLIIVAFAQVIVKLVLTKIS